VQVELYASRFGTMAPPGKLETKQQTSMHHVLRLDGIETLAPILNLAIRHYVRPTPLSLCPAISLKLPLHKPTPYATIGRHGGKPMTILGVTRREFVAALGGAAAWPLVARAQQPAMPVIGYLDSRSAERTGGAATAFRRSLAEAGYVEKRNVSIEYRWADDDNAQLPALAADLVHRQVNLILASGGSALAAQAAKRATSTIPIVFIVGANPISRGLVASLAHPGGNLTGVTFLSDELGAKRLGLLRELIPQATTVAYLNAYLTGAPGPVQGELTDILAAAKSVEREIVAFDARNNDDLDTAFATFVQRGAAALVVGAFPFLVDNRRKIVMLAARHKLPAIYPTAAFVAAGGLASYSAHETEGFRQAALYVGRILKGEKPAELPVQQATTFRLVINLKTAQALGLEVPPTLLARADEVIE
jgi:putative ABC transport system substrate-binding protein